MLYSKTVCLFLAVSCCLVVQLTWAQSNQLIDAVRKNNLEEIKTLVQKGFDVNAYDEDSDNVLINGALYASAECMKFLLQQKANPNLKNKYGQAPLMLCTNDREKMQLLLQFGADINDTSKSGNSAFLMACMGHGRYETIQWLLQKGANMQAKRWQTETALMRAAQFSDTLTIGFLLDKGFDINHHPWGFTPLTYAVRMGNWDAVMYLTRHGADVNIVDDLNTVPVLWAAVANHLDAVLAMLPSTKNINVADNKFGMTPLIWATLNETDNPLIIQALLDKGADVNIKAKDGSTALSRAMKKGNTQTVALLRKAGGIE